MREGPASRWLDQYHRDGYYAPLRVLSPEEARACRARLEAFEAAHGGPLQSDLRHRAHVFLTEKELEREVLYGGFPGGSPVEW